jgi:hypothetical protein
VITGCFLFVCFLLIAADPNKNDFEEEQEGDEDEKREMLVRRFIQQCSDIGFKENVARIVLASSDCSLEELCENKQKGMRSVSLSSYNLVTLLRVCNL